MREWCVERRAVELSNSRLTKTGFQSISCVAAAPTHYSAARRCLASRCGVRVDNHLEDNMGGSANLGKSHRFCEKSPLLQLISLSSTFWAIF